MLSEFLNAQYDIIFIVSFHYYYNVIQYNNNTELRNKLNISDPRANKVLPKLIFLLYSIISLIMSQSIRESTASIKIQNLLLVGKMDASKCPTFVFSEK